MVVGLITARGGSKGLPRKNILPLAGIPLITWTINAALESSGIDVVYVSTDDIEIKLISEESGAICIDRPKSLAADTSSSEDVVLHAIDYFERLGQPINTIVLLQPTSPLRTARHIDEALEVYYTKKASLVLSVFEPSHTPIKAYIQNKNGELEGLYSEKAPYLRRQDLPLAFQPNGALYIFSKDTFLKNQMFPRTKVFPYIMSEQESGDIDTLDDLLQVENLIKEK